MYVELIRDRNGFLGKVSRQTQQSNTGKFKSLTMTSFFPRFALLANYSNLNLNCPNSRVFPSKTEFSPMLKVISKIGPGGAP